MARRTCLHSFVRKCSQIAVQTKTGRYTDTGMVTCEVLRSGTHYSRLFYDRLGGATFPRCSTQWSSQSLITIRTRLKKNRLTKEMPATMPKRGPIPASGEVVV